MGGSAMAKYGGKRLPRREYFRLASKVLGKLKAKFPTNTFKEIPSYHHKESYGDLDILCLPGQAGWFDEVLEDFEVKHFKKNGSVMSFLYEEFQVDLISMPEEDFETAITYYSYNDLGNLMGKLFHKFGIKYGHRGLSMPLRDGNNQYGEVILSKEESKPFEFLGLDYEHFQRGFDNLEEIFNFVISSKYFSSEPYQYENLNAINRVRDRKRETYKSFLTFVQGMPSKYTFETDKDKYLPYIFAFFPGSEKQYFEARLHLSHLREVKAHFNGDLVREWTGLDGKELGGFMAAAKGWYGPFEEWVLDFTQEELKDKILKVRKDFNLQEKT